jgi:hypothetical protein
MTLRVVGSIALVAGAVFALIGLETMGFGLLLLIPAGVVMREHLLRRQCALVIITFAVGYLVGIGFFAVRTSGIVASGVIDWGVTSYYASLAAVGVLLLLAGIVMYLRRRVGHERVGSGGSHEATNSR